MISLTRFADAREAYRHKGLRQALYDEGHRLMDGVIVNLHGVAHLDRRRLENRLFRRDTFAWYEAERIPAIIDNVLAPALHSGRGDLLPLARRTMLTLSLMVAGVDRRQNDDAELDEIYGLMDRLARASTVAHALGDKEAIIAEGDRALAEFARDFFEPSRRRRAEILSRLTSGAIEEDELPKDVLTTLLRNQDRLVLPEETVLREVAYFPWVGSHSTSNQLVHAMHHVFEWLNEHASDRQRLIDDPVVFQRFVHESLRLHPASPVSLRLALEDVELKSGVRIPAGEQVAIRLDDVNRDPSIWGDDAERFDPFRRLPDGVMPWGLSFGHGVHACLGQELAGGVEFLDSDPRGAPVGHLVGAITVMGRFMLAVGARPDPDRPPELDRTTTRQVWGMYPVLFGPTVPGN
ncbi:MAG: cytochrome P450 [Ilumatobacteraceae bacterium]